MQVKGFAEVCIYYINLAIIIKTLRKKLTKTSKIAVLCVVSILCLAKSYMYVFIEDHLKNFREVAQYRNGSVVID
jgi:LytS/YehU family sensor histidine kinase